MVNEEEWNPKKWKEQVKQMRLTLFGPFIAEFKRRQKPELEVDDSVKNPDGWDRA